MSLIRLRRERKAGISGGPTRPPSLWKLLAALLIVGFLLWQLA